MMMRWAILPVTLTLTLLAPTDWPQTKPESAKNPIPQVQAVIRWLQAVKEADLKKLKEVFCESMRKRFDDEGWEKVLKTYQQIFEKEFGEYRLEDFTFAYSGGEQEGQVAIVFKEKKLPDVQVIKEKDEWKIDER